jgi:hypothetical protein
VVLRRLARLLPEPVRKTIRLWRLLSVELGHFRSVKTGRAVDRDGQPLPWYTYPAIAFLEQFDHREKNVFEYGGGSSSLYWSERARRVVVVESDPAWYRFLEERAPSNLTVLHELEQVRYVAAIRSVGGPDGRFDVVVLDGEHRRECAVAAAEQLSPDGMLVLDNSDWYPETCEMLRGKDFLQVDFGGIGPVNAYTWTTSLFLRRSIVLVPLDGRQPRPPVGGVRKDLG